MNMMFNWRKMGLIFNPSDLKEKSWMKEYAQAPSVVVFGSFIRVFFSSRPFPDAFGKYITRMAYIDLDRNNLFRIISVCPEPILPLGEIGTFDEFGTYPVSVIQNGSEIRAYYAGWTRCESVPFNAAIGLAISNDDGLTFSKMGKGPVLSYTSDEPFVLGSPKIRKFGNKWYLWYSSGKKWVKGGTKPEPVYKIRMAVSDDGVNWVKVGKDLIENVLDSDECQAGADVFLLNGTYHMFFCYRYNLSKSYKVGYAASQDLLHWSRDDRKAGIIKSEQGWDSESISYPFVFHLDNKVLMLYQGNEIGKYGFGLAQLENYK